MLTNQCDRLFLTVCNFAEICDVEIYWWENSLVFCYFHSEGQSAARICH